MRFFGVAKVGDRLNWPAVFRNGERPERSERKKGEKSRKKEEKDEGEKMTGEKYRDSGIFIVRGNAGALMRALRINFLFAASPVDGFAPASSSSSLVKGITLSRIYPPWWGVR